MPRLPQTAPTPTVVPSLRGNLATPAIADAARPTIPGPAAWPYTGGISQYRIGRGPVITPISVRLGYRPGGTW